MIFFMGIEEQNILYDLYPKLYFLASFSLVIHKVWEV